MTNPTQPRSKTLTVNGLASHYLEWGAADTPPIVCVHGYTGSADAFKALARHLRDRYRILAPDVRGHGESACDLHRSNDGILSARARGGMDMAMDGDRRGLDDYEHKRSADHHNPRN